MSLPNIGSVHWTAKAFFTVTLVTGILSVFYACLLQQHLSGLLTSEDIKDWLSQPTDIIDREMRRIDQDFHAIVKAHRKSRSTRDSEPAVERPGQVSPAQTEKEAKEMFEHGTSTRTGDQKTRIASFRTAVMIKSPTILLETSLVALLFGLGIYLGSLWHRHLEAPWPKYQSLCVLIFYLAFTMFWLALFFGLMFSKFAETAPIKRWDAYFSRYPSESDSGSVLAPHEKGGPLFENTREIREERSQQSKQVSGIGLDPVIAALEASIQAQEQSTAALRKLLEEHQKRGP